MNSLIRLNSFPVSLYSCRGTPSRKGIHKSKKLPKWITAKRIIKIRIRCSTNPTSIVFVRASNSLSTIDKNTKTSSCFIRFRNMFTKLIAASGHKCILEPGICVLMTRGGNSSWMETYKAIEKIPFHRGLNFSFSLPFAMSVFSSLHSSLDTGQNSQMCLFNSLELIDEKSCNNLEQIRLIFDKFDHFRSVSDRFVQIWCFNQIWSFLVILVIFSWTESF